MALKLEFINVIVPVASIREKFGNDTFDTHFAAATPVSWQDGHLFREGCMNEYDLADILDDWKAKGFELIAINHGQKQWKDVCVVYSGYGPSYPCEWIEYDAEKNIAWLKGESPGTVVGPTD